MKSTINAKVTQLICYRESVTLIVKTNPINDVLKNVAVVDKLLVGVVVKTDESCSSRYNGENGIAKAFGHWI